jgi:hypothetical protein
MWRIYSNPDPHGGVYCDVNINTFIFTELIAKANIHFVLFDGKNVLQKYISNNFDFKKKKHCRTFVDRMFP